jgi:hypothetical protein
MPASASAVKPCDEMGYQRACETFAWHRPRKVTGTRAEGRYREVLRKSAGQYILIASGGRQALGNSPSGCSAGVLPQACNMDLRQLRDSTRHPTTAAKPANRHAIIRIHN